MTRLPRSMKDKLAKSLAKGKIPAHGKPGYDDFFDIFGEFTIALADDATDKKAPPVRRHVAALVAVWSAIPCDGVLTGIACNQLEVLPVAIKAATAFKLPKVAKGLREIAKHVPKPVLSMDDPGDRLEWYQSAKGKKAAAKLETLFDKLYDEDDFGNSIMLACMTRVLAEPAVFFKA